MKKKIGTMLDEELIFKAKQAALTERQALSHFLTNALKMYLQSLEKKKDRVQKGRLRHFARRNEIIHQNLESHPGRRKGL